MLQHIILQGEVARVLQLQEEVTHKAVSMALLMAARCGGAETTLKSGSWSCKHKEGTCASSEAAAGPCFFWEARGPTGGLPDHTLKLGLVAARSPR